MIKVITDSAADIPKEEVQQYGIRVMPIPITVDGVAYHESVDFTSEEYYGMLLAAKSIPTTAQITMMEFADAFREELAAGYQNLICVTITAKGSGIYDAACLARQTVLEELPAGSGATIDIVDSAMYTYAYGHAVVAASRAAKEGLSRETVLGILRQELDGYQVYFALTNLDFAKKSGRITSAAAFVGELLGFRPILAIKDGETATISKVRGDHKIITALVDYFQKCASSDGRGFYILHAQSDELTRELKKTLEKTTGRKCLGEYRIGASVTTNAGPTVFGVIVPSDRPL